MKVLFIGGTGIISSAVTELAAARDYELFVLNRGTRRGQLPPNVQWLAGDIRDLPGVKSLLGGMKFDVVVDWVAFETPAHPKRFEVFECGGRTIYFYQFGFGLSKTPRTPRNN